VTICHEVTASILIISAIEPESPFSILDRPLAIRLTAHRQYELLTLFRSISRSFTSSWAVWSADPSQIETPHAKQVTRD
jgi:hypothetical protein